MAFISENMIFVLATDVAYLAAETLRLAYAIISSAIESARIKDVCNVGLASSVSNNSKVGRGQRGAGGWRCCVIVSGQVSG